MSSLCVLCSSCSQFLSDSGDVYCIQKCGHVYHGECLRKIIYKRTCSICYAQYDARQCRKLNIFSGSVVEPEKHPYSHEYDWMYCDHKTNFEQQEMSKFCLKLGTDSKNDDIYAARVFLNKHMLPAYYVPARKCAIATIGGRAYELKEDIDLLDITIDDPNLYKWAKYENDQVPENAFDITEFPSASELDAEINAPNKSDERLYIARAQYKGKLLYGKLCSSNSGESNNIYLAFGNEEIKFNTNGEETCEVLVRYP